MAGEATDRIRGGDAPADAAEPSRPATFDVSAPSQGGVVLTARGHWTIAEGGTLEKAMRALRLPEGAGTVAVDLASLEALDTAGAWFLLRLVADIRQRGVEVSLDGVQARHKPLIDLVARIHGERTPGFHKPATSLLGLLEQMGRGFVGAARRARDLVNFVGLVTLVFLRTAARPKRLRPKALITQIEVTGLDALPIVGLLSFLIGVVLAYLMSDQLKRFGAEVYTVDLIGLSILREIGVLLTAILIAGRSGSAFTAQIGTMQVNEEVDAMGTLGLDSIEVLVLPRVLALMLTLPLLTFFSDIMGILGGAVMSIIALDLSPVQFMNQLKGAVGIDDFLVGVVKAPVHAYIIAMVGCFEGLRVARTAESVGRQTTLSVVESIFLVIVATSVFAVLFSLLGI